MQINLFFLWHMHQPDYRNEEGKMYMPWVFLHSIKDYYEMPYLLSKFDNLKATFNISSTLINQIKIYETEGIKNDIFLSYLVKKTEELSDKEKVFILKICKSLQPKMLSDFNRLQEIFHFENYDNQELTDLEVLFLLAWCSRYLKEHNEIVKKLVKKGRLFTFQEKIELINTLIDFIKKIFPFYKSLLEKEQISVSTTPYYHPILPLLLDMENAKIANPKTDIVANAVSLKEDAILHIDKSISVFKEVFDEIPTGFWPAEGAIDEESIKIYKEKGIKWIATDELILFKSLNSYEKENIYDLYEFNDVCIGFRNRFLSDKIGFEYQNYDVKSATNDFIKSIKSIKKKNPNVFIILDGENAWEFYENNAYDFFMELYEKLSNEKSINTGRFDDTLNLSKKELNKISPGSWINGTFDTWAGHKEKNKAWELIFKAKQDIKNLNLSKEKKSLIKEHFLSLECSDWFWWYGDDHLTDFSLEFDSLFRNHLLEIYKIAGIKINDDLFKPICSLKNTHIDRIEIKSEISPVINGKVDSFFEWFGAGFIDLASKYSTMDTIRKTIKKIYYGKDDKSLFIRFDLDIEQIFTKFKKIKLIFENINKSFQIPVQKKYFSSEINMAIDEILEISLNNKYLLNERKLFLKIELITNEEESENYFDNLPFELDLNYENNWFL